MFIPSECDVLVVGSGCSGFSAALSAVEHGARKVVLVEKCPQEWAGGNSHFTAGAFRITHDGLSDLRPLVNNVDEETAGLVDLEPYTSEQFQQDLERMSSGRIDQHLSHVLVGDSHAAVQWLHRHEVPFQLSFDRQAYQIEGRYKFWGGLALKTENAGKGLITALQEAAQRLGVVVYYSSAVRQLLTDRETGAVTGVEVELAWTDDGEAASSAGKVATIRAAAVILAAGGFEANPGMRTAYLGSGWDHAHLRGTPYNTGELLEAAMHDVVIQARPAGNWSGCHAVAWDAYAPAYSGNQVMTNAYTKSGYPLGLMVNAKGMRFVDEGYDLHNYTAAAFGRAILQQPGSCAFQLWDAQTSPWLRPEEYGSSVLVRGRVTAQSLEDLADFLAADHGLQDPDALMTTVRTYNRAAYCSRLANPKLRWDPSIRDGLSTQSSRAKLALPKSNWALPLAAPPFTAVKVACGISFTFGGLAVNPETAAVLSLSGREVPGLYAVGEMIGGLFYGNYPGGSGLTSAVVFGRRAGQAAARRAEDAQPKGLYS